MRNTEATAYHLQSVGDVVDVSAALLLPCLLQSRYIPSAIDEAKAYSRLNITQSRAARNRALSDKTITEALGGKKVL
jgi:hypothetical protein